MQSVYVTMQVLMTWSLRLSLLSITLWASHFTSLSLIFLKYKTRIIVPLNRVVKIQWNDPHKVVRIWPLVTWSSLSLLNLGSITGWWKSYFQPFWNYANACEGWWQGRWVQRDTDSTQAWTKWVVLISSTGETSLTTCHSSSLQDSAMPVIPPVVVLTEPTACWMLRLHATLVTAARFMLLQ